MDKKTEKKLKKNLTIAISFKWFCIIIALILAILMVIQVKITGFMPFADIKYTVAFSFLILWALFMVIENQIRLAGFLMEKL